MLPIKQNLIQVQQFGTFWELTPTKCKISRLQLRNVSSQIGFRIYRGDLYKIIGKFIFPSSERDYIDTLREYIDHEDNDYQRICDTFDEFMQKNGKYTITNLQLIYRHQFLNDASNSCYKFFKNGYLKIMAHRVFYRDYINFPKGKYILSTKIQHRDYAECEDGKYIEFLKLATNFSLYEHNIKSIIGYLCHEYKDETTGYIIVLTEQCPDPKDGGGSGKNVFCNLLSHSTTLHSKNGSQVKYDEKFFQSWNGQRIMVISDVPDKFNYEFLKEPSTGTFIQKKLFKDEVEIPVEDGPKFIIPTNFSYTISDGGLQRRIIPIEFTDFFTKAGGVDSHFKGCHFPKGWSQKDWHNYDSIIVESVQTWLKSKLKLTAVELTETGWTKQFEHTFGVIAEYVADNFSTWANAIKTPSKTINDGLNEFYISKGTANIYRSSKKLPGAIREWAKHYKYNVEGNKAERLDPISDPVKCYVITKKQ